MKKVLGFVVVLALGQSAMATSLRDVRLHLEVGPAMTDLSRTKMSENILVYGDGEVVGRTCKFVGLRHGIPHCSSKTIAELSSYEMDRIQRLIDRASRGEIIEPDFGAPRCLAMPIETRRYTADNASVLLESGTYPCGGITYNESRSAQRLVEMLRNYQSQYHKLLGSN